MIQSDNQRGKQLLIINNGLRDKREWCSWVSQPAAQQGRFQVKHAVAKHLLRCRRAIMYLVRMQHNDLARSAEPLASAIPKSLNTSERYTDGIGVVPVRFECIAVKRSLDPFNSPGRRRGDDLLVSALCARTFKTGKNLGCKADVRPS